MLHKRLFFCFCSSQLSVSTNVSGVANLRITAKNNEFMLVLKVLAAAALKKFLCLLSSPKGISIYPKGVREAILYFYAVRLVMALTVMCLLAMQLSRLRPHYCLYLLSLATRALLCLRINLSLHASTK